MRIDANSWYYTTIEKNEHVIRFLHTGDWQLGITRHFILKRFRKDSPILRVSEQRNRDVMFDSKEELLQKIHLGEDTAQNNLKDKRANDPVLFYHSQQERAVVGIMEVTRRAKSDPPAPLIMRRIFLDGLLSK